MAGTDDWQQFNIREGIEFARQGLRTLILINGGAAVALLAFLSRSNEGGFDINAGLRWSLVTFALGTLTATGAYLAAYLSQLYFAEQNVTGAHLSRAHGWARGRHLIGDCLLVLVRCRSHFGRMCNRIANIL
ncbi:MAG: hypothetical protein GEU91_21565 [Rhizobiales bacterium]|nr:hypothetical protein [Hyphomicrobiales bacterium]